MAHETGSYERMWTEMLSNRNLLEGEKISTLDFCQHCVLGKQKKVSFNTDKHKTIGVLDYIHSDFMGSF